jgi:hypothetical protein
VHIAHRRRAIWLSSAQRPSSISLLNKIAAAVGAARFHALLELLDRLGSFSRVRAAPCRGERPREGSCPEPFE